MTQEQIGVAVRRVASILQRKPALGLHDDLAASVLWQGGLKTVATYENGFVLETDMPEELGGSGQGVTPGWFMRAGLASCTATCVAMSAASEGIELTLLEVTASSSSDLRGMFGMADEDGQTISAGPCLVQLRVRIAAPGVSAERLRQIVERSNQCSPVASALQNSTRLDLDVEVEGN